MRPRSLASFAGRAAWAANRPRSLASFAGRAVWAANRCRYLAPVAGAADQRPLRRFHPS
jgi:hypothetical protein